MSFKLFSRLACFNTITISNSAASAKYPHNHTRFCFAFILTVLLMYPVFAFSGMVYSRNITPELRCSNSLSGEITVSVKLGEFSTDDSGKINLNEYWQKYRIDKSNEPVLALDVIIDLSGDYEAEVVPGSGAESVADLRLSKPYIYRDLRGITVYVSPFKMVDDSILADSELEIRIRKTGKAGINQKTGAIYKLNPYFIDNYKQHFLNFDCRYEDIGESGSMAIICYEDFLNQMVPYVEWKRQKGISTEIYTVSQAGNNHEEIKAFIQNLYDTDSTLTFVQLVGDFEQVPSLIAGDSNSYGPRDPYYAMLEGDDFYPEIFVGRFSAETVVELNTQIVRSLEYEKASHAGNWMSRASVACSNNPPMPGDDDEHNWDHLRNIRTKLLNYTYTEVDSVFANEGADTEDLANSINAGKSLLVYCGEGYETYWLAPEFHNEDVENLTNDNMLPFIQCVSCYVGQFEGMTCLSEAFMRAENPLTNEPTGAIGIYASAPTQTVAEPMRSQDHFIDLLVNGTKNTMGGLCYNGSCNMIDVYGEIGEYLMLGWNLFGDASLQLRTAYPENLNVTVNNIIPSGTTSLIVQTNKADVLVCLSRNNVITASGFTNESGTINLDLITPTATGEIYQLTCTGFNAMPLQQNITCFSENEGYLNISDITYTDNEDGVINCAEDITIYFEVSNPSQIAVNNVLVEIVSADTLLTITDNNLQLGNIGANGLAAAQLGFSISKYCPDYQQVQYVIKVHSDSGIWNFNYSIRVHTPRLKILSARITPEENWLNPGDEVTVEYEILNEGSGGLKNTTCHLSTDQTWIQIIQSQKTVQAIPTDSTFTVVFPVRIKPGAEVNSLFELDFISESVNAPQLAHAENHLVVPSGVMMESFEPGLEDRFSWLYPQSASWKITGLSYDGKNCLKTPSLAQNQSTSAEISFIKECSWYQTRNLVFYLKTGGAPENHLHFYINGVEQESWSNVSDWQKAEYVLEEGATTLKWTYEQTGNPVSGEDFAYLDAIQFPAGSAFADAVLESETEAVNITIHPDQIIRSPVILKSRDGRYIYYHTILQKDRDNAPKYESAWLSFNRSNFTPGDIDNYLVKLYNTMQDMVVTQVSLLLNCYTMALSATNLSMQTAQPLTCVSDFPQNGHVIWKNQEGTSADSLRCVLVLATDISITSVPLIYNLLLRDTNGTFYSREGSITLTADGASEDFLYAYPYVGDLFEQESERLTLSCYEPSLPEDLSGYRLVIYYNGLNSISLPINITYDPTPGTDTSQLTLRAYPNPFSDNLKIEYYMPNFDIADFAVYNIKGQKVTDFHNKQDYPGQNLLVWDGKDKNGKRLATGVYIIRLKTWEGKEKITRCLLLK